MYGNQYKLKKQLRPEWYENGEAKTLSPEEIALWESSASGLSTRSKMAAVSEIGEDLSRFLDGLSSRDAEDEYKELLKGERERPANE